MRLSGGPSSRSTDERCATITFVLTTLTDRTRPHQIVDRLTLLSADHVALQNFQWAVDFCLLFTGQLKCKGPGLSIPLTGCHQLQCLQLCSHGFTRLHPEQLILRLVDGVAAPLEPALPALALMQGSSQRCRAAPRVQHQQPKLLFALLAHDSPLNADDGSVARRMEAFEARCWWSRAVAQLGSQPGEQGSHRLWPSCCK